MTSSHQSYYYEDSHFQLELNLQTIRRELISVLEEFEETGCLVCYNLKNCKCPELSDNFTERTESIPEASAKILHQETVRESFEDIDRETLVHRLLRDQEAYPDAAPELLKVNTAEHIYHSAKLKAFKMMTLLSMPETLVPSVYHPQIIYTSAPPARALPQSVWVGLNWPQRYVPVMKPGIPGVPVKPVIPGQVWPTSLRSMAMTQGSTPQVQQTRDSPVDAFFRRFQSSLGSFGTWSYETSESLDCDQVVPDGSERIDRFNR